MLKSLSVAILLGCVSISPVTAEEHNWEGGYAGLFSSYSFGKLRGSIVGGSSMSSTDMEGVGTGISAGFNIQREKIVYGIEADIQKNHVTGKRQCSSTQECTNKLDWSANLRVRLGVLQGKTLLFASGGLAVANGLSTTSPATVSTTGTDRQTFVGWTVGIGFEHALKDNLRVKAEYLYSDLGSKTSPAGTVGSSAYEGSPKFNSIRVGVNHAF